MQSSHTSYRENCILKVKEKSMAIGIRVHRLYDISSHVQIQQYLQVTCDQGSVANHP